MRHSLRRLCGAGALVLPLSVMVTLPALAQQTTVRDLSGGSSFYDQTATRAEAGGSLALFNEVEQHKRELRELRGQIEELRYQLDQLKQQTRQQYMDLDGRLANMSSLPPAPSTAQGTSDTSAQASSGESSSQASSNDSDAVDSDARSAYQSAFAKVQSRDFDQAIGEFDGFVERYPDSPLAANAWYWLGELHSAQSSFADSESSFARVLSDFPDSTKVPDAMYKLGLLKARQGDEDEGRALLRSLKEDYPDSNAAALADDYLRQSGA